MEPRPCYVTDDQGHRWPGVVLEWRRDHDGWRGYCRYTITTAEGYRLQRLHWCAASDLAPRADDA